MYYARKHGLTFEALFAAGGLAIGLVLVISKNWANLTTV